MKKLISILILALVSLATFAAEPALMRGFATTNVFNGSVFLQTNRGGLQFSPEQRRAATGVSRVLYVSTTGNNATAAVNNPNRPWRDIFNVTDVDPANSRSTGALAVATSGDVVVVLPGTYVQPKIPIPNGVHLFAPYRARVIATNEVWNGDLASMHAIGLSQGPLVVPGNNSTVEGFDFLTFTNTSYNAAVGWYVGGNFNDGTAAFPFADKSATNALFKNCYFWGTTDCLYLSDTNSGVGATISFDNCVMNGSWDAFRSFGSNHVVYTRDSIFFTTNTYSQVNHAGSPMPLGSSRTVVITSPMTWFDVGSVIRGGGGTNECLTTWITGGAAAYFDGTRLELTSTAKNFGTNLVTTGYGTLPHGWFLETITNLVTSRVRVNEAHVLTAVFANNISSSNAVEGVQVTATGFVSGPAIYAGSTTFSETEMAPASGNYSFDTYGTATFSGAVSAVSLVVGTPTITSGAGAPSASEPNGSLYLRTDGGASTTLYIRHTGTWLAK